MFRFFKTNEMFTEHNLRDLTTCIRQKLRQRFPGKTVEPLILVLNQRMSAFDYHITHTISAAEKQTFINAYYIFAKCMNDCIAQYDTKERLNPKGLVDISDLVHSYYSSPHYLRVGGVQGEHTLTGFDQVASALVAFSLALIVSSIVVFAFSFPVALVIAIVGFTILAPSLFYNLAETHGHEAVVQCQEQTLFATLNEIMNNQGPSPEELHPYGEIVLSTA